MTNRFAGPMFRLKRLMQQAAAGEHVEPITFRDDDYWHEFANDFNQLIVRMESLARVNASTSDIVPTCVAEELEESLVEV